MENIERHIPEPFEIYKHFKGKLYQILSIATHSETNENLVIYQALYDDFGVYARPLNMFLSEVDKTKYPNSNAKYRFTKVKLLPSQSGYDNSKPVSATSEKNTPVHTGVVYSSGQVVSSSISEPTNEEKLQKKAQKLFMEFLDEDDFTKKSNILKAISGIATDSMINNMAASLDLVVSGTSRDNDIKVIDDYIKARIHFDGTRLRERQINYFNL